MACSHYGVDNLTVFVDRNNLQVLRTGGIAHAPGRRKKSMEGKGARSNEVCMGHGKTDNRDKG